MPRIGKCGGELSIGSYSTRECGKATAYCEKCSKEYTLWMRGKSRFYKRMR